MEGFIFYVVIIGLFALFVISVVLASISLRKSVEKIHKELDLVEKTTKDSWTKEELDNARKQLFEVYKKCNDEYQIIRAREIKAIIITKYEFLNRTTK